MPSLYYRARSSDRAPRGRGPHQGYPTGTEMSETFHTSISRPLLLKAVDELCRIDADLARVVTTHGPPPLWARPPGFATLVRIILEQQVSLASARAAFLRLQAGAGRVAAGRLARLSPARILKFGITRRKPRFLSGLA